MVLLLSKQVIEWDCTLSVVKLKFLTLWFYRSFAHRPKLGRRRENFGFAIAFLNCSGWVPATSTALLDNLDAAF